MFCKKQGIGLLGLMVLMVACEQASETVVGIPNVAVQCEAATNPPCNASVNGNNVIVIMSRSGCGDSVNFEPIATGSIALNCDAQGCEGTVVQWNDRNSNPVSEVLTGRMDICGTIEINPLDSSLDLSSEDSENIQSNATITVDTWSGS